MSGDPEARHGVVLTASYEARVFGVKTAMPTGEAHRLCPEAIIVRPDFKLYSDRSRACYENPLFLYSTGGTVLN
ncbi:MAG: hypothetical protein ACOX2S_06145 [bacterium]